MPVTNASLTKRMTVRALAKIAGVSPMRVSLALRNHPDASEQTRTRIQKLALEHGYVPDPKIAKLMRHLRERPANQLKSTLGAITHRSWQTSAPREMLDGAKERARQIGYGLDAIEYESFRGNFARLQTMLHTRGIDGLLLMPGHESFSLPADLDWRDFHVVAANYMGTCVRAHCVVSNQFTNSMHLFAQLRQLGYERIGLAISENRDRETQRHITAALAWHHSNGAHAIPALLFEQSDARVFRRWYRKNTPDVVVAEHDLCAKWMLDVLDANERSAGFACLSLDPGSSMTGIYARPGHIGARAVDALNEVIIRGEKSLPAVPSVTMIEGVWSAGNTARGRQTSTKLS